MALLLHDLLLDTRQRSEHMLQELAALEGALPADVEQFRKLWLRYVQTCRSRIDGLLSDPDLDNPRLTSNFYISYKSVMQFLFEVEAGPLVVLGRFGDSDLLVTRTVSQICKEIGYPHSAPLGSTGSSQYYGALPNVDIVVVPALEGHHLLGLADLYHELAHFVLRRHTQALMAPFQATIDDTFARVTEDAKRRNATQPELDLIEDSRLSWRMSWHEEFAADMIATFCVGPAFGWANVRLCTNMSSTLFKGGALHPADAARHAGIDLMLRALGCDSEASRISDWWQELLGLGSATAPNDFDLIYPPDLLESLCEFLNQCCPSIGLISWPDRSTSNAVHMGVLLNEAWEQFRASPEQFADYEHEVVKKLREHLGLS